MVGYPPLRRQVGRFASFALNGHASAGKLLCVALFQFHTQTSCCVYSLFRLFIDHACDIDVCVQVETHIAVREAVQQGEVLAPLFSAVDGMISNSIHVSYAYKILLNECWLMLVRVLVQSYCAYALSCGLVEYAPKDVLTVSMRFRHAIFRMYCPFFS